MNESGSVHINHHFSHVTVISVKQHSDKKSLEGYDKDSECVHRLLPIEFINEK